MPGFVHTTRLSQHYQERTSLCPSYKMDLKDTLNLPSTQFPMRGNLVQREPERLAHWEQLRLYERIQEKNGANPAFILHDGPPFTNGNVHIGTALNKILKDTILRYKSMRGMRTPYVPGWDCHGLPIEHKVAKELREQEKSLSPAELRAACAQFSADYIEIQRSQFKRLGILADWASEYKTMSPEYEATILRTFAAFVAKDLVYRSKKPVYWSIPCKTALAEAEIEYAEHSSPSIWVNFDIPEHSLAHIQGPLGIVIWTTTPWTLPANLAVAVHPRLLYQEVQSAGKTYLVAQELAEAFIQACALEDATLGKTHSGAELEHLNARHPFIDRASPIVLAEYVTTDSGTGCVHTAPGHGQEDYLTGLNYGLEIYCPLDDEGCYLDDGMIPESLVGVSVLETKGKCPANAAVLSLLKASGALLKVEKYSHQYPHCWRSKTPVIFRAMDQWFVALDKASMREKVLEAIERVEWIPKWGFNRISAAVQARPDWCISRQRSWGVPIPVFYSEDGQPLLDVTVIERLADKVAQHGTRIWFEQSAEQLLDGIELPEAFRNQPLTKGLDTLDVWIDSGCSHRAVLAQHPQLSWPADLYLEGSDQHRGWFQSSLWTGVIADGQAPYKKIITHGFIVNEKGRKIAKSEGAMSSDDWVKQFGADIVRFWVSSQDFTTEIRLSQDHFKLVSGNYRTVRNTLMYQLGNLADFNPSQDAVPFDQIDPIDQWALSKTSELIDKVTAAYETYEFHKVYQLLCNYFRGVLSNTYHDILKDRLYTYAPDSPLRRSSQTAMKLIFDAIVRLIAPVLTFTADEAYSFAKTGSEFSDDSVHLQDWPQISPDLYDSDTATEIDSLLVFRDRVNEQLEKLRQQKLIGSSLEARVVITAPESDPISAFLQKYAERLPELFITSEVDVLVRQDASFDVKAEKTQGIRCPRCWRQVNELIESTIEHKLCERCAETTSGLKMV